MTKRRRSIQSDDDWEQDIDSISDVSTDLESDNRDTSFILTRKSTGKSKRARDNAYTDGALGSKNYTDCTHLRSLHSIREPTAMRVELLKWYKTVENNRGMPWRRPYNPGLGDADRAQRAYEVRRPYSVFIH